MKLAVLVAMPTMIGADKPQLAAGFIAGVVVSCLVAWGGWIAILMLAGASGLGAIGHWGLRHARNLQMERSARERLRRRMHRAGRMRMNEGTASGVLPVTAGATEPESSPEEFVAFHDFNSARGRFEHW